jgi:hypothetical protein
MVTLMESLPEWTGDVLAKLSVAQPQFCQPFSSASS